MENSLNKVFSASGLYRLLENCTHAVIYHAQRIDYCCLIRGVFMKKIFLLLAVSFVGYSLDGSSPASPLSSIIKKCLYEGSDLDELRRFVRGKKVPQSSIEQLEKTHNPKLFPLREYPTKLTATSKKIFFIKTSLIKQQ